jgi:hypothetical protein
VAASSRDGLKDRIDQIETTYEFMLAYAAQGLSSEQASESGAQMRDALQRTEAAVRELPDSFAAVVEESDTDSSAAYEDFLQVLREDVQKAGAALRLTLAQPSISSQLVDNLNASIHIRALLTDVFLLDEILEQRRAKV